MARIRIVGRTRGGRCVFCHDGLSGEVRQCPECGAAWHPECGAEASRPRCPTVGCTGPAPAAEVRRGRRRRVQPTASPEVTSRGPRRRPGAFARLGPYVRLAFSALVTTLSMTACAAFLAWPVLEPTAFWKFVSTGKNRTQLAWPLALGKSLVLLGMAGVFGWLAWTWLRQVPSVWRELGQLLDDTTPTAMRMTTFTTGSGKSKRRYARLDPVGAGPQVTLQLDGLLPPWWLGFKTGQRVLVYGLPPPGPYIFEFEDGMLALVHPDD